MIREVKLNTLHMFDGEEYKQNKDYPLWQKIAAYMDGEAAAVLESKFGTGYAFLCLKDSTKDKELSYMMEQDSVIGTFINDREGFDKAWDSGEYTGKDEFFCLESKYLIFEPDKKDSESDMQTTDEAMQPIKVTTLDGRTVYECRNCGNDLSTNRLNEIHCHWCGQKLDWRKENEKMDRLTKRIDGDAYGAKGINKYNLAGVYCRGEFEATACIDKLAEYEDAEEQGKLLKLPCKVGDIVFDLVLCDDSQYRIFEMRVCNINYFGDVHKGKVWNVYLEDKHSKSYRSFYDFGKTVFLTHEQAELALKGLKERQKNEIN